MRLSHGIEQGIAATGIVKGNSVTDVVAGDGVGGVGIVATGIVTGNYVINAARLDLGIGQGSTVIGNTAMVLFPVMRTGSA